MAKPIYIASIQHISGSPERQSIINDLVKDRQIWKLSAFAPVAQSAAQLFGGYPREQSYEEVRLRHYTASQDPQQLQQAMSEYDKLVKDSEDQMQHVIDNIDEAVKYLAETANVHPNRIDICRNSQTQAGTQAANPFIQAASSQVTKCIIAPQQSQQPKFGVPSVQNGTFGAPSVANGAFGAPSVPNGTFGAPSVANGTFGAPSVPNGTFGAPSVANGTFGAPSVANGAFGAPSVPNGTFGAPSVANGTFGAPSMPNRTFGAPSMSNGVFGQPSVLGQKVSPFATLKPTEPNNVFGKPSLVGDTLNTTNNSQQNPFGQVKETPSINPFAQLASNNKPNNPFQRTQTSVFGAPSPLGTNISSSFPNPSNQSNPQNKSNPFGQQTQTNPFGQKTQPNPFGQQTQMNPFGQQTQTNPFGQQTQTNPFGQKTQPNPFGQQAQPNPFGQQIQTNPFNQQSQPSSFSELKPQDSLSTQNNANKPNLFGSHNPQHDLFSRTSKTPGPGSEVPKPNALNRNSQQPNIKPNISDGITNPLTSFNGKTVVYKDKSPGFLNQDGSWEKIWFPEGKPIFSHDAEMPAEEEYEEAIIQAYDYARKNKVFKAGIIPLLPPKEEWCSFDF
ncbi:hypothetical protein K3495_g2400 [Podosphaera aphanis]|nr:hypothetical protein K3495_g2400 [Podosphaera aphanis]